jgi:hypothetical protein
MFTLYNSIGTLRYGYSHLILDIDPEITRYYRSFLPKSLYVKLPLYPAHVSIVRKESSLFLEKVSHLWGKYEGEKVEYVYSPLIHNRGVYFWLNAFSIRLEEIREELGLPLISYYKDIPERYKHTFHSTMGNIK